jgi:hypothetical protein
MLQFVKHRFDTLKHFAILKQEIKLFNIVQVLLDGGYVFCKDTLTQALKIAGIKAMFIEYEQERQTRLWAKYRAHTGDTQALQTAEMFCNLLGFDYLIKLDLQHKPPGFKN